MSHGLTLLERAKQYEQYAKGFEKITKDIMENNSTYYGVLSLKEDFDLLFGLFSDSRQYAVSVAIYRGFPKLKAAAAEGTEDPIIIYLSVALKMFPEIKKIRFVKNQWPEPYKKKEK